MAQAGGERGTAPPHGGAGVHGWQAHQKEDESGELRSAVWVPGAYDARPQITVTHNIPVRQGSRDGRFRTDGIALVKQRLHLLGMTRRRHAVEEVRARDL